MKAKGSSRRAKPAKVDAETRIRRMTEGWFITEPLLFSTFLTHRVTRNDHIATLRTGDGRIEYHPRFIDALDDETLGELLKLEAVRIVLKHPYSRRPPIGEVAYLASNITLKEHLRTSLPLPSAAEVFGDDALSGQYYELYCDRLLQQQTYSSRPQRGEGEAESDAEGQGGDADADGEMATSQGGSSEPGDGEEARGAEDHFDAQSGSERTQLWQEDSLVREQIDDVIREAESSQSWGSLPGKLVVRILATLKPRLDYRRLLRSFGTSILASRRELTRLKPSRRYGFDYMGSRHALRTRLLVAVDVSGSINDVELQHAYSVINRLFQYGMESIDTLQFDTELKGPVNTFSKKRFKVEIKGRGGTDFRPVLAFIDEHRNYDGLIIVTDGCAGIPPRPKNRRTRVLWLFTHESTYQASAQKLSHIGRAVFIRPDSVGESRHGGSRRS